MWSNTNNTTASTTASANANKATPSIHKRAEQKVKISILDNLKLCDARGDQHNFFFLMALLFAESFSTIFQDVVTTMRVVSVSLNGNGIRLWPPGERESETKMKKKIKQRNTIGQLPTTKILMNKYRWEGGYKRNLNRIFSHKVWTVRLALN